MQKDRQTNTIEAEPPSIDINKLTNYCSKIEKQKPGRPTNIRRISNMFELFWKSQTYLPDIKRNFRSYDTLWSYLPSPLCKIMSLLCLTVLRWYTSESYSVPDHDQNYDIEQIKGSPDCHFTGYR